MSEETTLKHCPECNEPLYYGVGFQIWCLSCGYVEKPKIQETQDKPAPETTVLSANIKLTLRDAPPQVTEYVKYHLNGETVAVEDDGKAHRLNSSFVSWFLCRIDPVVGWSADNELYEAWLKNWSLTAMIMLNEGPLEEEIPFDDDAQQTRKCSNCGEELDSLGICWHCQNDEDDEDDTEYPDQYHWLCNCGHFQEDGLHCSNCGAEPPWGCPCSLCEEKHFEDEDEDDYSPGPWDD